MNIQTLDLDDTDSYTEELSYIAKCPYVYKCKIERSPSGNGFHIIIWCLKENCVECRAKFDDPFRFYADMTNREKPERNVLFNRKKKYNYK